MISLKAVLLSVCLLFYIPTFAGSITKITSKNGEVILKNGKKISGELHFFYRSDLLKIKINDHLSKALTPHQVDRFKFYDKNFNSERIFVSVPKVFSNTYHHGFFEVISSGEFNVIGKLLYENKAYKSIYRNPRLKSNKVVKSSLVTHDFYIFYENKLIPLEQHLATLRHEDEEISSFIESKQLRLNQIPDQLKVVTFYNKKSANNDFFMQKFIKKK